MLHGVVKFFDLVKGYGFIQRDDWEADVFVGRKTLRRLGLDDLRGGERVMFDIRVSVDGKFPEADNISVLE